MSKESEIEKALNDYLLFVEKNTIMLSVLSGQPPLDPIIEFLKHQKNLFLEKIKTERND